MGPHRAVSRGEVSNGLVGVTAARGKPARRGVGTGKAGRRGPGRWRAEQLVVGAGRVPTCGSCGAADECGSSGSGRLNPGPPVDDTVTGGPGPHVLSASGHDVALAHAGKGNEGGGPHDVVPCPCRGQGMPGMGRERWPPCWRGARSPRMSKEGARGRGWASVARRPNTGPKARSATGQTRGSNQQLGALALAVRTGGGLLDTALPSRLTSAMGRLGQKGDDPESQARQADSAAATTGRALPPPARWAVALDDGRRWWDMARSGSRTSVLSKGRASRTCGVHGEQKPTRKPARGRRLAFPALGRTGQPAGGGAGHAPGRWPPGPMHEGYR